MCWSQTLMALTDLHICYPIAQPLLRGVFCIDLHGSLITSSGKIMQFSMACHLSLTTPRSRHVFFTLPLPTTSGPVSQASSSIGHPMHPPQPPRAMATPPGKTESRRKHSTRHNSLPLTQTTPSSAKVHNGPIQDVFGRSPQRPFMIPKRWASHRVAGHTQFVGCAVTSSLGDFFSYSGCGGVRLYGSGHRRRYHPPPTQK